MQPDDPVSDIDFEHYPPLDISFAMPDKVCPEGMVKVDNGFCIDQYEWPNKKGELPDFAIDAHQSERYCISVGKRLCEHKEWVKACRGTQNFQFGYAVNRVNNTCNDQKLEYRQPNWNLMFSPQWKDYASTLYRGDPSGSHMLCVSYELDGVAYDMVGNVREWVHSPGSLYGYVIEGEYWFGSMAGHLGCDSSINEHGSSFASYEFGTRCCKDLQ